MEPGTYDRELFIEVVLTEGVRLLYVDNKLVDGFIVEWYEGINGKKVAIPLDDDCFSHSVVKFYLDKLGLASLIPRLFPDAPKKKSDTPEGFKVFNPEDELKVEPKKKD